ncbi:MAG: M10 family metallopeptidase C-terminal domain-containing protein [Pseudomonadota bacterium]
MCHICLQHAEADWERQEAAQPGVVPADTGKPLWTTSQIIEQLRTVSQVWDNVIEYTIPLTADFYPLGEADGFSPLNSLQAQQARLVYELWDDLIAPSFVETADATTADLKIANTTTNIVYAHAFPPWGGGFGGTVWLNGNNATLQNPTSGFHGFHAMIHEIGHTLGLEHAGNYNGGRPSYDETAEYAQDSLMFSSMSYFYASNTGADWFSHDHKYHYAQTPMLHDILAIQAMYGADMTTRTEDTVYGYNSNTNSPIYDFTQNEHPVLTIWDAGGIDTLDLSEMYPDLFNKGSVVNLAPGSFSDAGWMTNNIAIAYGTWIENAIGGRGNDIITGNELDNRLIGNAGDDVIEGLAGNDYIDGGAGRDTLSGGDGNDTIVYDANDNLDALSGGAGTDTLLIRGGTLPVFDLVARGFEYAEHEQTGTGGFGWSTKTDRYDASWQKVSESGAYDYGDTFQTYYDVDNTKNWLSYTNMFNELGQRFQQTGERDNGQTWSYSFDVGNAGTWSRINTTYDTSNIAWWHSIEQFIDDNGQTYLRTGTRDDGSTWQHIYDVDNLEAWSRFTYEFDAQGLLTKTAGRFDEGETWNELYDTAGTKFWSQIVNRFTAEGDKYNQTGVKDDGQTWSHAWDVNETEVWSRITTRNDVPDLAPWAEHTVYFNDNNQKYRQTAIKDDGDAWEHIWDREGTEVWHRQTIYRDLQDIRGWSERIQTFDDNGTLLSTSFIDDII